MNSKTFSNLLVVNGDGFMFGGKEKLPAMSNNRNGGFGSGGSFAKRLAAEGVPSYSTVEILRALSLSSVSYKSGVATSLDVLKDEDENYFGFAFKPPSISNSSSDLQPLGNLVSFGYNHPQALEGAHVES
eukprot:Gb_12230 [translate_table: standard]